jgi:hypothetical protein
MTSQQTLNITRIASHDYRVLVAKGGGCDSRIEKKRRRSAALVSLTSIV